MGIKRNTKYEESSFVTFSEGTKGPATSTPIEEIPIKEFAKAPPKVPKFIHPLSNRPDLMDEISGKKEKEGGSFFSLNENIMSQNNTDNLNNNNDITIPRSKSFGNDITEAIPFIDSTEENGNIEDTSFDNAAFMLKNENKALITNDDVDANLNVKNFTESFSAPNTPNRSEKYAQTDDSSESPEKRTPKRRFPRLGTFERIKVEKRVTLDPNSPVIASPIHTRTGTSFRHRRHIKTTVSKEQLLKATAVSPSKEEEEKDTSETPSESPVADKKKDKRGIFSRLFKRESKSLDYQKQDVSTGDVPMANLEETPPPERPTNIDLPGSPKRPSWVSCILKYFLGHVLKTCIISFNSYFQIDF